MPASPAPTPQQVFDALITTVDAAVLRPELEVRAIPAPSGLAPFAHATDARAHPDHDEREVRHQE